VAAAVHAEDLALDGVRLHEEGDGLGDLVRPAPAAQGGELLDGFDLLLGVPV
jgi:hypothetical protein